MTNVYRSLFGLLFLLLAGCAVNTEKADVIAPGVITKSSVFYVEHFAPDKRNFHKDIADAIAKRGYKATSGEPGAAPTEATVIVTYLDKWMWDLTNYMLELNITFRDHNSQPISVGNSLHTSLTRLSPPEMIEEVLTNMFAKLEGG